MAHYIDKDSLVSGIHRLRDFANAHWDIEEVNGVDKFIDKLTSYINSLEVKELDLDALDVLAEHLIACDAHGITPIYKGRELDILEGLANNKAHKGA